MIAKIPTPLGGVPVPDIMALSIPEHIIAIRRSNRGKIHLKSDFDRYLEFQFNPTELNLTKRNRWEMLQYTGRVGVDPIWIGGDAKTVQFTITVDATTCSIYDYVGGRNTIDDINRPGLSETPQTVENALEPRGTLKFIEMLESFQYPVGEYDTEWFKDGMAKLTKQFLPPPDLVFTFGEFYLVCKMSELSISHKLFNQKLIPIRSEANITLVIKENESDEVDTSVYVSPKMKSNPVSDFNSYNVT